MGKIQKGRIITIAVALGLIALLYSLGNLILGLLMAIITIVFGYIYFVIVEKSRTSIPNQPIVNQQINNEKPKFRLGIIAFIFSLLSALLFLTGIAVFFAWPVLVLLASIGTTLGIIDIIIIKKKKYDFRYAKFGYISIILGATILSLLLLFIVFIIKG